MATLAVKEETIALIRSKLYDWGEVSGKDFQEAGQYEVQKEKVDGLLKEIEEHLFKQIASGVLVVGAEKSYGNGCGKRSALGKVDENVKTAGRNNPTVEGTGQSALDESVLMRETSKLQNEVDHLAAKIAFHRQNSKQHFLRLARDAIQQRRPLGIEDQEILETNNDIQSDDSVDRKLDERISAIRAEYSALQKRLNNSFNKLRRHVETVESEHVHSKLSFAMDLLTESEGK